ncbi:MAG: hypothetical protein Q9203_001640 [Teloschistes exilis]
MSGCDITAFTTTTGASCPLISLDPNDDQGGDGTMDPSSTTPSTIIILSTTTVDPTPSPRSTTTSTVIVYPSPTPSPTPINFYIGWALFADLGWPFPGNPKYEHVDWIIYVIERDKPYDVCEQTGFDTKNAYYLGASVKGHNPKYPISLGDFDSEFADKVECRYNRLSDDEGKKNNNPGSLTCSGVLAECIDDPADDTHVCKDNDYPLLAWHPQVICSFDGGLLNQPNSCAGDQCGAGPADPRGPHSKI